MKQDTRSPHCSLGHKHRLGALVDDPVRCDPRRKHGDRSRMTVPHNDAGSHAFNWNTSFSSSPPDRRSRAALTANCGPGIPSIKYPETISPPSSHELKRPEKLLPPEPGKLTVRHSPKTIPYRSRSSLACSLLTFSSSISSSSSTSSSPWSRYQKPSSGREVFHRTSPERPGRRGPLRSVPSPPAARAAENPCSIPFR